MTVLPFARRNTFSPNLLTSFRKAIGRFRHARAAVLHGATLGPVPTSYPRHSITETPALAAALEPLRARLGAEAPTLAELVLRGAEAKLREVEAQDRADAQALKTFVDRLCGGPDPDLDEIRHIRHTSRHP